MNEQEMIFAGVACLLLVVIGVLQALQLRATKEAEAAAVSRQAALLEALAGTGSAFTQAVDRFQQVVVTLENLALLQQIADRVDAGCTRIEDCHARLESQVETAGRVVENLHQLVGFTSSKTALNNAIEGISGGISIDPSTDLYGAIIKASDLAAMALDTIIGQGILGAASIVIFTDGTDQAARYTKTEALNKVNGLDPRIAVFSIGLGAEIDQATLKSIGTDGSIFADSTSQLESKFIEVANLIAAEANSYYLFQYCSPKRDGSGSNDLIIEVTAGGKKGYLKTSFDATGFTSGCN